MAGGHSANYKWSSISFPSVSSLARPGGQAGDIMFAAKGVSDEGLRKGPEEGGSGMAAWSSFLGPLGREGSEQGGAKGSGL